MVTLISFLPVSSLLPTPFTGLPRAASWANKGTASVTTTASTSSATRSSRRSGIRQTRNAQGSQLDTRTSSTTPRTQPERRPGSTTAVNKASSQASSSRPSTPASSVLPQRPITPAGVGVLRQKRVSHPPQPQPSCRSPTLESDLGSGPHDAAPISPAIRPRSTESIQSSAASILSAPSAPPGFPVFPPGLSAPPGIPTSGARPSRPDTTSPQTPITPLLASQSSYQMSTAAQALLDDVKARWKTNSTAMNASPFPDLDRTLQTLSAGDGQYSGFSFNLDPKLAGDKDVEDLPDFEAGADIPFQGTYLDAFPGLKGPSTSFMAPPGSPYPHSPIRSIHDHTALRPLSATAVDKPDGSAYKGSFNPFADNQDSVTSSQASQPSLDDNGERKMSRFGFAQGRKGSTTASSPMNVPSPLGNSDGQTPFYTTPEPISAQSQWLESTSRPRFSEFVYSPRTAPLAHTIQTPSTYPPSQSRFQPFESSVSEPQLRDLIQTNPIHNEPSGTRFPYA